MSNDAIERDKALAAMQDAIRDDVSDALDADGVTWAEPTP